MAYILFIMFFVTAPNDISPKLKNTPQDKRVWILQSTTVMEFASSKQCLKAEGDIVDSIKDTNTINARSWCIGKGTTGIPSGDAKTEKVEPRQDNADEIIRIPLKK
jgi:hypothetical protein